jgi:hypothetical protein
MRIKRAGFGLAITILLGISVAAIMYLYPVPYFPYSPEEPAGAGDLLAAVVPGVFSLLLAGLYFDMTGIQGRQVELQKTQNKIDRAAREPHINVTDIEPDSDIVAFELKNIGDGIAEDLSVVAHLYIRRIDEDPISIGEPIHRNQLTLTGSGNLITSLESGEKQEYSAEIYLPSQEHEELDEKFRSVINNIIDESADDFSDIYVQFEIQYGHQMPDRDRGKQYLQPMKVSFDRGPTVENVLSSSSTAQDGIQSIISTSDNTLHVPTTEYE